MDEKDVVKIGAEAALKPFSDLIEKLFGGAVEEIGGMWQDRLQVRRFERRLKFLKRLQTGVADAGFEPRHIPERIWVPAMQQVSMEDDETLHDAWAKLLTTAASPNGAATPPAYPAILSQLSGNEVGFLDCLYTFVNEKAQRQGNRDHRKSMRVSESAEPDALNTPIGTLRHLEDLFYRNCWFTQTARLVAKKEAFEQETLRTLSDLLQINPNEDEEYLATKRGFEYEWDKVASEAHKADALEFSFIVEHLTHLGVITISSSTETRSGDHMSRESHYSFSLLGYKFVRACRTPQSRAGSEPPLRERQTPSPA